MSSITSTCTHRYDSAARLSGGLRLSRAGRYSRGARPLELVYRNMRPLVQTVQPPAPRIIQTTVHQTVVHLHQTTHRHILNRLSAARDGQGNTTLLIKQTAAPPADGGAIDVSRPALAARRMLRILSTESARQILRPFYQGIFQDLLDREREEYRGKPAQSLLLVQSILGRCQTQAALRRVYRQTEEKLDGTIVHHLIYRRCIRHIQQDGGGGVLRRYAGSERAVPEDLRHLPAARRFSPPPQPPIEREPDCGPKENPAKAAPVSGQGLRLGNAEFQLLVRGVADALGRQSRLEELRRGGM